MGGMFRQNRGTGTASPSVNIPKSSGNVDNQDELTEFEKAAYGYKPVTSKSGSVKSASGTVRSTRINR